MLQDATAQFLPIYDECGHARDAALRLNMLTAIWHVPEPPFISGDDLIAGLHRANFDLWHLEDRARDPAATDTSVAEVKRLIDATNQVRNDLAERLDEVLLDFLARSSLPAPSAPLHSETPGQIFDRLSILALKLFHTAEESRRPGATEAHRERNCTRVALLTEQQNDLAGCLSALWQQVLQGKKRFKQYRQFKMYNDPDLNPVLYRASAARLSL